MIFKSSKVVLITITVCIAVCCAIIIGFIYFLDRIGEDDKKRMELIYSTWFQIPANGEGKLALFRKQTQAFSFKNENEFGFGNVGDSCTTREDVYLVFNYHPEDSMFMFRYIDSLDIDTALHMHTLKFYLYLWDVRPFYQSRYWELQYQKLPFDTLYDAQTNKAIPSMTNKKLNFIRFPEFSKDYQHNRSEYYKFVYDEQLKHFRPVKEEKQYYFRKKDGDISPYPVAFYN